MKKEHKDNIWERALDRLCELYGDQPDLLILNRFYSEKMMMQQSDYVRLLDLCGTIRKRAEKLGEHIWVRGTVGSSFVAYLLDATEINPLPLHEYCPECKRVRFTQRRMSAFEHSGVTCACGAETRLEGYNLPFEANLRSVFAETVQICVSHAFFKVACAEIRSHMSDKAIIASGDEKEISLIRFYFADDNKMPKLPDSMNDINLPHVTLVPDKTLDKYRELELKTGKMMQDIKLSSCDMSPLRNGDISGIPNVDSDFMRDLIETTKPVNHDDFLKLIGFAHGTNVWRNNAELYYYGQQWTLRQIPAFREDVYDMICQKLRERGIRETGFAYEVALKTRQGYYEKNDMEDTTHDMLMELGFDVLFYLFLNNVKYMFPKAHAISYLKDALLLTWYKTCFPEEYRKIFDLKEEK